MKVTAQIRFPGVTPEQVFTMLVDPAFQERKCLANGALDHAVEVTRTADGGARISTRRDLPTDDVPDLVRGFVGATLTVRQVDAWGRPDDAGRRSGTVEVEIPGTPVRLTGALRLYAADGDTVQEVDGDLKAAVPLIGGKIEKAASPAIHGAIRVEEREGQAWLAEHG